MSPYATVGATGGIGPCVFVYLKTQFSNAGDALIIREQVRIFRALGRIRAARSGAPQAFLSELGLAQDEIFEGGWLRLVMRVAWGALRTSERPFLLLPPGDPGGGVSAGALARCMVFPLLAMLGVRIVRVGFSLGRLSPARMRLESWISRWCHFQGIRDLLSINDAKHYGFHRVGYFPDLSLNTPHMTAMRGPAMTARPRVALSFRGDNIGESERSATIETVFATLAPYRQSATLVGVVQVQRDQAFVEQVMEEARRRGFKTEAAVFTSFNLTELAAQYATCDLVLSNRLHVFLFGALNGATPLAVIDEVRNRKITGILQTIGIAGYSCGIDAQGRSALDPSTLSPDAVAGAFQRQKAEIAHVLAVIADRS